MNPETEDLIEAQILGLRELAKKLEAKANSLREDNAYLKKENAQLWESIHERDDLIRELQEMNVRGRCA